MEGGDGGEQVTGIELRPMTVAEVDRIADLVLAGGWADFRRQLAFAVGSSDCVAVVAEVGGEPAGVGVGTRNGTVGWLGPIFTAPARRGHGVGRGLTEAVARWLEEAGCATLLLAATDLGRPVYERLGFVAFGRYHVLSGPAAALPEPGPNLYPLGPGDWAAVDALDRWASGEERAHLLGAFGREGAGWVVADDASGRLRGYALATPWGAGPVVAPDPVDALALLRRSATLGEDGRLTAVLPAENAMGRALLAGLGFVEARSLPRMQRGASVAWRPEAIWRLFSFGMG